MFNYPPEFGPWISHAFQALCLLICGPILYRLFSFYNRSFKEEGAASPGLVRPALSLAYACLATVLVGANIWFLPQLSSSVLAVLPVLSSDKKYFIYATHSIVSSAFIVNYTNSVETLQEMEHGVYGGTVEWGKMIAGTRPWVQWSDTIARLLIGACFVWLEGNLWRAGRVDLATMTFSFGQPDSIDIPSYRGLLADIADSAWGVYAAIATWFAITLLVMRANESANFRGRLARRVVWRQAKIILFGAAISSYTLYIARGHLALFDRDSVPHQLDDEYVFAACLMAALFGVLLIAEVGKRVWSFLSESEPKPQVVNNSS